MALKKTAKRKPATKKATPKRKVAKKVTTKKAAPKKAVAKKSTAKKAAPKRAVAKKAKPAAKPKKRVAKKRTAKASAAKPTKGTKYSPLAGKEVEKEMHKFKEGTAKSGKAETPVKSREQAIAIGLSEARKKGAKVPKKRK